MPLSPERLRAIAHKIVHECAGVRPGENVYIEGRLDSVDYLEMLALECELAGGRPLMIARSDELLRRRLDELSPEQLEVASQSWIDAVKAADVVFSVRLEDGKPQLFADAPADKMGAHRRGRKLISDHIYDGSRRWVGTDYPTVEQAAAFHLDFAAFEEMFWRALDVDYRALSERAERVCAVLDGAREVRVRSAKGTDLALRIDGRPLDRDIGVVTDAAKLTNLPAGEVCLAPLESSAEGRVIFDLAFRNGVRIEDLEVQFTGGVAQALGAACGLETFQQVVATATGAANVIGELGIGLNPEVGEPCGYTLTDEKILGTVHIAVGDNRMLGGVNDSSLHWDMMILAPSVEVDGTPLLEQGDLVV